MNKKLKKRLIVVSGVVVIVLIIVLAVVGSGSAAKTVSVEQAASGEYSGKKVQVSGNVVADSYVMSGNTLSFTIEDADNPSFTVPVKYEGAVSATFGNGVTAICTGKIDASGVLQASEMVTKCPSKYESATDALTISRLRAYGDGVLDKPVKVTGFVVAGTLQPAGQDVRMQLAETAEAAQASAASATGATDAAAQDQQPLPVKYDGALPDSVTDGSELVLTGAINSSGVFVATDVALRG